jgi:hypothetical protein
MLKLTKIRLKFLVNELIKKESFQIIKFSSFLKYQCDIFFQSWWEPTLSSCAYRLAFGSSKKIIFSVFEFIFGEISLLYCASKLDASLDQQIHRQYSSAHDPTLRSMRINKFSIVMFFFISKKVMNDISSIPNQHLKI